MEGYGGSDHRVFERVREAVRYMTNAVTESDWAEVAGRSCCGVAGRPAKGQPVGWDLNLLVSSLEGHSDAPSMPWPLHRDPTVVRAEVVAISGAQESAGVSATGMGKSKNLLDEPNLHAWLHSTLLTFATCAAWALSRSWKHANSQRTASRLCARMDLDLQSVGR